MNGIHLQHIILIKQTLRHCVDDAMDPFIRRDGRQTTGTCPHLVRLPNSPDLIGPSKSSWALSELEDAALVLQWSWKWVFVELEKKYMDIGLLD